MTKRFKRIAVIISVITMMISTYVGVLAAHKLDNIPLGNTADLVSLDSPDENVGMVNVLLIGVDEDGYRSDTIMLVSLDDYSDRVSVLSIPRDTMVRINGSVQKINATMGFGLSKPTAARTPRTQTKTEIPTKTAMPRKTAKIKTRSPKANTTISTRPIWRSERATRTC